MNRKLLSILPILPILATISAVAQLPSSSALPSDRAASIVATSRIARFLAGPDDRPQGFLLRNGTFVSLSPGLAQQLPPTIAKNASIRVAGDQLSYNGNKTIEARSITVAGISYQDAGPATGAPLASHTAAPQAPPPAPSRPDAGPRGAAAPPLPPPPPAPAPSGPCSAAPVSNGPAAPPPPPLDNAAPPPPAPVSGAPAPPPNPPAAPQN